MENTNDLYKCNKCGKEKDQKEGMVEADGKTFCCDQCCKPGESEEAPNVCTFC